MEDMKEQVRDMETISPEENTTAFSVVFEVIIGKVLEMFKVQSSEPRS